MRRIGLHQRVLGMSLVTLATIGAVSPGLGAAGRPTGTNYLALRGGGSRTTTPAVGVGELLQCLLGPDVTVSNATLTAAPQAAGTFVGGLNVIGFEQGIILSSGDIGTLSGPNVGDATSTDNGAPGDPDLDALIPGYTTYDAVVLEFDFTCSSAQDVVFQYVLGSEEYNEYVDTPFNDVFGFFLNGSNIALAPTGCSGAGSVVSINNVNCGNPYIGSGPNCDCFRNNDLDDGGGAINTELDGLTQVFFATGTILPGTNHIKIALADAGDRVLDSDVMIRCQSFTCGGAPITGACCLTSGQCVTLTNGDCFANGGTYLGDFSSCSPNPCGTGFGACCFPDLSCEVEDPDFCGQNGGVYLGDGTVCIPNPCGAPVGACCYLGGLCLVEDAFTCGGDFQGDGSTCDPSPCGEETGACCADGGICEIQTPANCGDTFLGVGTLCDPNPCLDIAGACCHDSGFCEITLEADCGDSYQGNRTVCDPNPCQTPAGVEPEGPTSSPLRLAPPSPSPTAGRVELSWSVPTAGPARIALADATGRVIATLFEGDLSAGTGSRVFDLGSAAGRSLPAGVYWVRLEAAGVPSVQKVVIAN